MKRHVSAKHEALPREKNKRGDLLPPVYLATISQRPIMFEPRPGAGWWDITNKIELGDVLPDTLGFDELFTGGVSSRITDEIPLYELVLDGGGRVALYAKDVHPADAEYSYSDGSGVVRFPNAYTHSDLEVILGGHVIAKQIHLESGHESTFRFRLEGEFDPILEGGRLNLGNGLIMPIPELYYAGPGVIPEERLGPQRLDDWIVEAVDGGLDITLKLPKGDWEGWTLDPNLVLTPGAAEGKDTFSYSPLPDNNYGSAAVIQTGHQTESIGFIEFNLGSIPENSTFDAVTIRTYRSYTFGAPTVEHQRCDASWVESTLTHNAKPGVVGNVMGTFNHTGTPGTYTLTASDMELLFTGNNYGWRMYDSALNTNAYFYSSDHGTEALRPQLTISYSPPAGRLTAYSLNVWDPDRKILDPQGYRVPPNEVEPNRWLGLEGLDQPSAQTYPGYIEDPTKLLVVESRYKEGEDVPEIKSDRSQFGEVIMERVAGGSAG